MIVMRMRCAPGGRWIVAGGKREARRPRIRAWRFFSGAPEGAREHGKQARAPGGAQDHDSRPVPGAARFALAPGYSPAPLRAQGGIRESASCSGSSTTPPADIAARCKFSPFSAASPATPEWRRNIRLSSLQILSNSSPEPAQIEARKSEEIGAWRR